MDFVRPWLAIGTAVEAADPAVRRAAGIDAVLSLAPVDFDAGPAHLRLPVADRAPLPATAIRCATTFLEDQRRAGRTTLLHCVSGISRSPALATCALREHAGLALADALAEVVRVRPQAAPHADLLASIADYYGDAPLAEAAGPIDLSANESPFGASPAAIAAAQAALTAPQRYPDRSGTVLRAALAGRHGVAPTQIVLGNGCSEILDLAARAVLAPGDAALVLPPCFPAYATAIRRCGGRVVALPRRDAAMARAPADIAAAVAADARLRLIYLANPNNPTGDGWTTAALQSLLAVLPADCVVVLDEAYRDYVDDDRLADGIAVAAADPRLLVTRSFSKLHGLAGLRVGYGLGAPALIARLEALRPPYNVNAPALAAALAALSDPLHAAQVRRATVSARDALSAGLRALGFAVLPSLGNFVLARPGPGASAETLAAALAEAGIAVKPGAGFGVPEYLRISIGRPEMHRRLFAALAATLASSVEAHLQGN